MKVCEYCAKEISYHEMYCCEECESEADKFYDLQEKFQKPFSVINGIFVLMIGVSLFVYSMSRDIGAIGIAASLLILGTMYFFLPFPPDVMIHKVKLKKAIKITKIIAIAVFLLGAAVLTLYLTKII